MKHQQIPMLRPGTRLNIVREQIDAIQSIALPIGHWLLAARASNDAEPHKQPHPISGESLVAAETTFCKACSKLDAILDDPQLLNTADHDAVEKSMMKMVEENTKLIRTQRIGLEWANSPAARFEPMLVRLRENLWTAVLGDLQNHSNMVCGVGPSPNEALDNFNDVFAGRVSEPLAFYAETREKALKLDPGTAPPPIFDLGEIPPDNKP